jgi:excisionase family DNA binding protein
VVMQSICTIYRSIAYNLQQLCTSRAATLLRSDGGPSGRVSKLEKATPAHKLLCNVKEVMQVTGLGRSKIYEYILSGELRSIKVGRRRLIPTDAIPEFIAQLQAGTAVSQ